MSTTHTRPTAGGTLAAAEALRGPQQTFTREQVAYLMHLAYDAGRTATYLADLAEAHCTAEDNAWMRPTYEQTVADRITQMEADAARNPAATWRGRYPGGPVDFETGRPARHLGAVA